MSVILELNKIKAGYLKDVDILNGIDLQIQEGETVGIIGLNGSGKSTLGKSIMDMVPFRTGSIVYLGEDVSTLTTSQLSNMGINIFQQGGTVFEELSIWDNLLLAQGNSLNREELDTIRDYFPLLQMDKIKLMRRYANKLSGGQRHQLALAMNLLQKPKLLILDEPSAGLSPAGAKGIYETLNQIKGRSDLSIVLIEQNVSLAMEFCDKIFMLRNGRMEHEFENKEIKEIEKIIFKNE